MGSCFQLDEHTLNDNRLELEFRQILCIIKNSILYVNSSYNLSFYRAWLEKLNNPCADKYLRNIYLIRLARQIQGNYLSHPFTQNPPVGSLERIDDITSDDLNVDMDHVHYNDEIFPEEPQRLTQIAQIAFNQNDLPSESKNENHLSSDAVLKDNQHSLREYDGIKGCNLSLVNSEFISDSYDKKVPTKLKKRKLKYNNFKIYESSFAKDLTSEDGPESIEEPVKDARKGKIGNIQEDSSWYDLTDTSLTSIILNPLGSGDAVERAKVHEFKKNSNEILPEVDTSLIKPQELPPSFEDNSNNGNEEIKDMKHSLKYTHYIYADWKKTIESLQLRLTETLTQNNELKVTIEKLTAQILMVEKQREQSECYQKQLREVHKKEVDKLEKMKEENLMTLEKSFQLKFDEAQTSYCENLQELARSYELKINASKIDNDNIKKEKDKEIYRLSDIIQHQCSRISEEIKALRNQMETFSGNNNNADEKIITLQKCISKMDKLFHKSEREYLKQIEKLKQDLVKRDKITQIQLKTQKAELIARTSAEKQRQFDELVNNLEVKYIRMLEYHETEVMENKKEDDGKIEYLKHLLDQYDIPYNIL